MKKKLLYPLLCALFLLTAACNAPSPESLREADGKAVLLPPEPAEDSAMFAPSSAVEVLLDPDSIYAKTEMCEFLDRVWSREPASITLTAMPEDWGEPSHSRIIYDGVVFTVAEAHGKISNCCYYTDLTTTATPQGTTIYQLTGLGLFEGRSLSGPGFFPNNYYLAELSPTDDEPPAPSPSQPDGPELTGPYPPDTATANVDYVNCHGILYNEDIMTQFLTHADALEEASIRTVQYTPEGNPILTDVTFDGSIFNVTKDSTQDAFGSQDRFTNQYARLEHVYLPDPDITEYRFTEPLHVEYPLDYMVLKYDLGDTTSP